MKTPEVGQTVYFVPAGRHARAAELVVTKVGRKYFYAAREIGTFEIRFHLDTWRAEFNGSDRLWPSRAEYEVSEMRARDWKTLRNAMSMEYNAPEGVSRAMMRRVADLLKLSIDW